MKMMNLGNTDMKISRIGLGTWAIGGGPAWGGDKDLDECINTIRSCKDLGVNLLDTAPGYNFGQSEKIVGKALAGGFRDDFTVITKCGIVWTREGSLFNKVGDTQLYKNLSPESIEEEIEQSLERLGIDCIDIYMTHWQSVEPFFTPIGQTMETLLSLKEKGKIKAIGAANISPEQVLEYLKYGELDIVQAKYSVLDRAIEKDLIPICKQHNITLQAYSPLEQGLLSGALGRDYVPIGAQCNKKWFQPENMPKAMDMMDGWQDLCKKYDCTIANLALAWILAQGDFITILSGSTTVAEIEENVKSANLVLDPADAAKMRQMAEAIDN